MFARTKNPLLLAAITTFVVAACGGARGKPASSTYEGTLEVKNPRGSHHGPDATCKTHGDCAQISCICNQSTHPALAAGVCTPSGTCQKASVTCSFPCGQGGVRSATVLDDLGDSSDCATLCEKVEATKCSYETSCARRTRCAIRADECAAQAEARLACQAKQRWICGGRVGFAYPEDEMKCMNLGTACPPDDPAPR